jgi:hypothetical protein
MIVKTKKKKAAAKKSLKQLTSTELKQVVGAWDGGGLATQSIRVY